MDLPLYVQLTFLCVVNIIFAFSGVVLNTLVIASFFKSSQLRKKLCYFMIMVLSCCDLLTVITNNPLFVVQIVLWLNENYELLDYTMIYSLIAPLFVGFSSLTLLVMSFERYLGVSYPIFHRTSITKRRLQTILAILFVGPIALMLAFVYDESFSIQMATIIYMVVYVPPFIFINYKLFRISRKMRRNNTISPTNKKRIHLKSISTCLLAVACLVLSYTPASISVAFDFNEESITTMSLPFIWTATFYTMNCSFNTLIFFWKNKILRAEGKKVVKTLKEHLFGS